MISKALDWIIEHPLMGVPLVGFVGILISAGLSRPIRWLYARKKSHEKVTETQSSESGDGK